MRSEAYLDERVDDHVFANHLPIVRWAIGGRRYNSGRKEHGKDGGHLGRIFLQKGDRILEEF
jgi:hypothetical protein